MKTLGWVFLYATCKFSVDDFYSGISFVQEENCVHVQGDHFAQILDFRFTKGRQERDSVVMQTPCFRHAARYTFGVEMHFKIINGDVCDLRDVCDATAGGVDAVVHAAAAGMMVSLLF